MMRVLLTFFIMLHWLNAASQEVVNDWKELDERITFNEYIEHQAYSHVNFELTENDTTDNSGVRISHSSTATKLIIRDKGSVSPPNTPLIVINGYPIERQNILSKIKLTDVERISVIKSTQQSNAIYGIRGKYGVILIKMNKRMRKKLKKESYHR